jgi:hypothetical protein
MIRDGVFYNKDDYSISDTLMVLTIPFSVIGIEARLII